jgi:hypothetical protein
MHVKITGPFQVPKAGNSEADCEDKYCVPHYIIKKKTGFRYAMADGATESAFSGQWAQLLVDSYVKLNGLPKFKKLDPIIKGQASEWSKQVLSKSLPWFVYEKIQKGAFSTLLGVCLEEKMPRHIQMWSALAIGDTCVFQVRANSLMAKFPIQQASEFGYHPVLISTQPQSNAHLEIEMKSKTDGRWELSDQFLLMTDALAHWFLRGVEKGEQPWIDLLSITNGDEFVKWIDTLRAKKEIRNDDVTLLMLKVEP